jgi:hypothetical protein
MIKRSNDNNKNDNNKSILIGRSNLNECPFCFKHVHRTLLDSHAQICLSNLLSKEDCHKEREEQLLFDLKNTKKKFTNDNNDEGLLVLSENASGNDIDNDNDNKWIPSTARTKTARNKRANTERTITRTAARKTNDDEGSIYKFFIAKAVTTATTTTTTINDAHEKTEQKKEGDKENDDEDDDDDDNDNDEEEEEEEDVDVLAMNTEIEGGQMLNKTNFELNVMSGDYMTCGICLEPFDEKENVLRYMFYPCMHARQCKECAIRVWQTKKIRMKYAKTKTAKCPWCSQKIECRPKRFLPFL